MPELATTLMTALFSPAFTLFGAPTSWAELFGFISGAVCVWLVARANIWNWPVGIINAVFFFLLFGTAGLYADAGLQIVYVVLGVYGWWAWTHGGPKSDRLPISRITGNQWVALAAIGVAATGTLTLLLDAATPSTVPFFDAVTTVLSLLATWGQARKKLEAWWLWIAADVIYVPLYLYKGLTLTAILYVGFAALCVYGLTVWTRQLRAQTLR
jgi:nicotinamide mononucleotide transporter